MTQSYIKRMFLGQHGEADVHSIDVPSRSGSFLPFYSFPDRKKGKNLVQTELQKKKKEIRSFIFSLIYIYIISRKEK